MWICVGCWRDNDDDTDICPDCLTPRTAIACRCGFIFPNYEEYVKHRKSGCTDIGLIMLLKERLRKNE